MALTPKLLKEAWLDKTQPLVILDARAKAAERGFDLLRDGVPIRARAAGRHFLGRERLHGEP